MDYCLLYYDTNNLYTLRIIITTIERKQKKKKKITNIIYKRNTCAF